MILCVLASLPSSTQIITLTCAFRVVGPHLHHLKNLKVQESMGLNEIHPWVLRELVDEAAEPQSIILERLWQFCEVPTDCKRGNMTPIFKKMNKEDEGNYSPVSLTSVPSKIME